MWINGFLLSCTQKRYLYLTRYIQCIYILKEKSANIYTVDKKEPKIKKYHLHNRDLDLTTLVDFDLRL